MGHVLQKRLQQGTPLSPSAEATLNLLVAADHVRTRLEGACSTQGITHSQYNVLRILRGAHPDGHPRCEIARRMVERAPDVTRMIDRLEQRKLVARVRSKEDRRLSLTRITPAGIALLKKVDPVLQEWNEQWTDRFTATELRQLSRICEKIYSAEES
jgi:DNA-binding MarR family transcriptional regulator